MIIIVTHFWQIAQIKAHSVNATDLIAALNLPKTYLKKADDDVVGVRAEEIKNIIKNNLTILTNILPADITEMEEAIAYYALLEPAPKDAIDYRKVKGTDPIPDLLDKAEIPRDYLGKIFHTSLPEYIVQYEKAIKIGQPANQRHISAIITYFDAETGTPMRNVIATFTHSDEVYTKKSTKKGNARFTSLPTGNYSLTSQIKNYTPVTKNNIAINDNHKLKLNIKLQKIVPTATLHLLVGDKETAAPLNQVKLLIPSIGITLFTNENGTIQKSDIPPATYQALLSQPGYKNIDFTFTLDPHKTLDLEFLMEKL